MSRPIEAAGSRLFRLGREHLGLLLSSSVVVVVALRVYAVAGYDTTSALAVLQFGGHGAVLIGGLLGALPLIVALALYIFLAWILVSGSTRQKAGFWRTLLYVPLMVFPAVVFVPTKWLIMGLVALPFLLIVRWGMTPDDALTDVQIRNRPSVGETRAVLAAVILYPAFAFVHQPWVPTEIVTERGRLPVTGYVVGATDGITAVLIDEDRKIRYMKSEGLRRDLCTKETWWDIPPLRLLDPRPHDPCV